MHFLGTRNGKSTKTLITVTRTLMNSILPGMLSYSAAKHSPSFVDIEIVFVTHRGQTSEFTQHQQNSDNTLITGSPSVLFEGPFPDLRLGL